VPPENGNEGPGTDGSNGAGAGQGIEQNAFADIWVADRNDFSPTQKKVYRWQFQFSQTFRFQVERTSPKGCFYFFWLF
jgi:hypothetical protein